MQRKKPRVVLQDITNISSSFDNVNKDSSKQTIEATTDGSLTDLSEEDEMSADCDSDYGGTIDENIDQDWDCSSQESKDSDSETEDVVSVDPDTDQRNQRVKSLAAIMEQVFRSPAPKKSKKTLPKVVGNDI
ncbi:hypothetical protein Rs2_31564 [Raphanus sativus]|nr:hypothetical protein Rs2_31564 [Raphanus sativus]